MRTATDLKARWLAEIPLILERTSMWTRNGEKADTLCRRLLEDLCFLDERDPAQALADLQDYGSAGIVGAFRHWLGEDARCDAEAASVYAECFHRLGYLTVDRLVDWAPLANAALAGLGNLTSSRRCTAHRVWWWMDGSGATCPTTAGCTSTTGVPS